MTLQFLERLGEVTSLEPDRPLELSLFSVVRCPRVPGVGPSRGGLFNKLNYPRSQSHEDFLE